MGSPALLDAPLKGIFEGPGVRAKTFVGLGEGNALICKGDFFYLLILFCCEEPLSDLGRLCWALVLITFHRSSPIS